MNISTFQRGVLIATSSKQYANEILKMLTIPLLALSLFEPSFLLSEVIDVSQNFYYLQLQLSEMFLEMIAPSFNTLDLSQKLSLDIQSNASDVYLEILLTMLASPIIMKFPSYEEFLSTIRIKEFAIKAARKTSMDFHTDEATRPVEYWDYDEDAGFLVKPQKLIIEALKEATQPNLSGTSYAFSCYRATEYIILLAIAQEAKLSNQVLLDQLQAQWECRAIKSKRFHDVFLSETGNLENPLPIAYYVPGDRVWFRNPDPISSDVSGYEGSWVVYLGGGQFSNFWKNDQPYTLIAKCLEIYHWRHGVYRDSNDELQMDEDKVEQCVQNSLKNSEDVTTIFEKMYRLRDPSGVYDEGGCMDASRETVRSVHVKHCNIVMPGFY
jgi:hypothetical protein